MFSFINQFFNALSAFFRAAENGGKTLEVISEIGLQKAKAYHDEEAVKIRARIAKLEAGAKDGTLALEA